MSPEPRDGPISQEEIDRGRLLAAVAYLPALFLVGLLGAPQNRYVGFHARQGFLLFMVEIVAWIGLAIFDGTLGRLPLVGFLAGVTVHFGVGVILLGATVYGVLKGASGEMARLPYLGDAVDRVPF